MPFPPKTRTSKAGSNLKARAALAAYEERATAARRKPLDLAQKRFQRDQRAFLTKPVVLTATEIFRARRHAFDVALFEANGEAGTIAKARAKMRRSIDRALRQQVAGYAQFQTTQRANAETWRTLVNRQRLATIDAQVNLDAVLSDRLDNEEFAPPYPLYDVKRTQGDRTTDRGLADPRLGFVINSLTFDWDQQDRLFDFDLYPPTGSAQSAVGVNYTVPHTGRLTVSAVIQNLFNHVTASLSDNFGFSDGHLLVRLGLFIRILRGDVVTAFDRTLFEGRAVVHSPIFSAYLDGDLNSYSFSGFNMTTPYTIGAKTEETFEQGESVQVLVGSSVDIDCHLNDMVGKANALLAWHVKKLYLGVA